LKQAEDQSAGNLLQDLEENTPSMTPTIWGKIRTLLSTQPQKVSVYTGPERRKRPTPPLSRYSFWKGRRMYVDPTQTQDGAYVDIYSWRLAILLLLFFLFTVVDSVSTLVYLEKGGREVNPIAQWMIDQGDLFFILMKGVVSGLCILFVMIHKNFKYSRMALFIGFFVYLTLVVYHIALQIKAL
jgi:hypothetical protein